MTGHDVLLVIAAVLGFLLSFVVVADVVGRVAFNSPLKGTPEMVSISIVMICFLQAGYAVRSGGMINVDFLLVRMPARIQSYVMAAGALCGLGFFGLVCWGAVDPPSTPDIERVRGEARCACRRGRRGSSS